jgi:hypothetical protein
VPCSMAFLSACICGHLRLTFLSCFEAIRALRCVAFETHRPLRVAAADHITTTSLRSSHISHGSQFVGGQRCALCNTRMMRTVSPSMS